MFPVMNDQGLNTRLLEEKGVGVEIPRNEQDGSFTSDSRAESVKFAVVSEESESLRANARRKTSKEPQRPKLPPDMDYSFKRVLYEEDEEISQKPTIDTFTDNDEGFASEASSDGIDQELELEGLSVEENVSKVLSKWSPFLRKGSLSLTNRELGYLGLPERALETFCWVKKQPHLFPDDHILASTAEVLGGSNELKMPFDLDKFTGLASRSVYEAMLRGHIKGGRLKLALKLLSMAKESNRVLDTGVYAKLILELGKDPDKSTLVLVLLEELAVRDDLNLTPQDCTAIMKICIRLGRFEIVEGLYDWFREALAMLWGMEASNCLLDLPAYRVVIKFFVALNDLSRAVRYFSKLKEAGFSPTFDIYCSLIKVYMASGRLAKCKDICKEAEMAGFRFDEQTMLKLQQ
ncbi:hypothetical protein K7X08_017867 [Anisodus acutangulus]|uniref:Pentatricopeptide repeat-containing protein n=1 Tax=Anisodus acutangulus TaxID=402998 RepID=A0A9Q1LY66_9SOLA|nr:hypothetical protein K7X08_017867 [Anisodus acutangulus]